MAEPPLDNLYAHVRGLALNHGGVGPSDRELLDRYLASRDESAFAALVHRHGAMVLASCRRLLSCEQDAEDCWQATFLVLASRGRSIRQGPCLAGWLHGVACRIARKLQTKLLKRPHAPLVEVADRAAPPDLGWRETQAILDEELQRLPDHYRAPLVLCYLEGLTRDEAARQLGWSFEVLRGRLDRARERLRWQLTRRGVTLSGSLLGVALAGSAQAGAVPALLAVNVVRAATRPEMVSPHLAVLMEGVGVTMYWTNAKIAALVLLLTSIAGLSLGVLAQAPPGVKPSQSGGEPPSRKATPESDLAKRVAELEKQVAWLTQEVKTLRGVEPPKGEPATTIRLTLKNVTGHEALRIVKNLMGEAKGFRAVVDDQTNALIVSGTKEDVQKIQVIVEKVEAASVKPAQRSDAPVLKTFLLRSAKAADVAQVIARILPDPDARVSAAGEKTLVVFAVPKGVAQIADLVKQLEEAIEAELAVKAREQALERERLQKLGKPSGGN